MALKDARSKDSILQQRQQTPPSQAPQRQQQQHTFSTSSQPLSGFATPQSSPQSQGSNHHRNGNGTNYHYSSSSSEEDHEAFTSQESAMLGDLPSSGSYRTRRDSGLPPIKMTAAKRLPPFGANLSLVPTESQIMEEDEDEDEDYEEVEHENASNGNDSQEQQPQRTRRDHEDEISNIPLHDDRQQAMQMRDRDSTPKQASNLSRGATNGGSKQR
ncbi:hypothetical protein EDD11_007912 [Mortierella claussenii]|nr:hypothetical protein EDD11_007912 [Mortierella claussenii]